MKLFILNNEEMLTGNLIYKLKSDIAKMEHGEEMNIKIRRV